MIYGGGDDISLQIRKNFAKACVRSVALHGSEKRITGDAERRLEVFQVWCYRRLMRISCGQTKKSSEELERQEVCGRVWLREDVN
jgi:hypothetical protein